MATIQELLQTQKDWEDKKNLINSIGNAAQGFGNIQTMGEILKGKPQGQMAPSQLGSMVAGSNPLEQEMQSQKLASIEKEKMQDTPDSPLAKQMYLLGAARKIPGVVAGLKPSEYKDLFEANKLVGNDEEKFSNALKMQELRSNQALALKDMDNARKQQELLAKVEAKSLKSDNDFKSLPKENQEQISTIARKMGNQRTIKASIDSALTALTDPKQTDDQKITLGRSLLKTLNSQEGSDAIGAEEAKRLGSFLEYKLGNLTQPGSMFGRDLGEFVKQVDLTSKNLAGSINRNQGAIDSLYGRSPMVSASRPQPQQQSQSFGAMIPEAQASSRVVVRKGYNPKTNQTQLIYADGTKEIVDGKQ